MIQENRRHSRNFTQGIDHSGDGRAETRPDSETRKTRSQREAAPLSPPPRAGSKGKSRHIRTRESGLLTGAGATVGLRPGWQQCSDGGAAAATRRLLPHALQSPSGAPCWLSPARSRVVSRPENCSFDTLQSERRAGQISK